MRVSIKWLKDYLTVNIAPSELANRLTMAGNEVKAVEVIGGTWDKVIIGQVTALNPHPNADRLRLATVETGKGQETVVCGAFNFTVGDKVVFASVGAELTDGHTGQKLTLKAAKIRGVESKGMICSEMELGISKEHAGILVLPPDAPIGMPLQEYLGDTIIDLDVTPNRPDCLSVIGVARESAALTGEKVQIEEPHYPETEAPIADRISIEILAPDLCPRYSASLITGVKIMPSPRWIQERLMAAGLRPINNIVDISNYVMLEYGQPLHTFDYDKLRGKKIIVRRANSEENIISLDGVDRKLHPNMLVIADAERAVAVAGVMGGANSEVTDQTVSILVEAASFKATSIHYTGEALGLPSEARYRFERGIAPGLTIPALKRATQLIAEFGAGKVARGIVDVYPGNIPARRIHLSLEKLKRLLGVEFTPEKTAGTLISLGFDCQQGSSANEFEVTAPYWRSDIHIQEDLIEEVARVQGYDKIPNTLLAEPLPQVNPDPMFKLRRNVRLVMADYGFNETLNFSLIGMDLLSKLSPEGQYSGPQPMRVANPMTAEMEYLRVSLRSTQLMAFAANRRFEEGSIRLFEAGKIYLQREGNLPDERDTLCGVMGGLRFEKSWQDSNQILDFFDAKGIVEGLFGRLGLKPGFTKGDDAGLHPNKQAAIYIEKTKVGIVGEIHPRVLAAFDISEPVYLLEIDLKTLVSFAVIHEAYQPVPRYPSIVRDMALIVDMGITHREIVKTIQNSPLVDQVQIFDVYAGEQVAPGKKSLAYHITYRSSNHTLTDSEVDQIQQQILEKLNVELGAVLRS